ncbi:MAG: hypothetical protein EVA81_06160 [Proteobacteria bacterium]|nr:MAG: hypothetical protein EVA81_06160 [Pseudomonadota bacterium]
MSLLNRCSVQTEDIQTGSPGVTLFICMVGKQLFPALWFSILFSLALILISLPIYSQESEGVKFEQSLVEDPLAESDTDLGQEEDPLVESDPDLGQAEDPLAESDTDLGQAEDPLVESDPDLGQAEDPLAESDTDLGLEEDPLAESDTDLGLEEDPLVDSEAELDLDEEILEGESTEFDVLGKQESEEQLVSEEEEEVFPPRVTFNHEVKTMFGASETKGLDLLDPLLSEIKELRFVSTYDQSVKVQTSPRMYNYFRLSISFSQNYELEKQRIFDGFASVREIYSNYRVGSHQLRYGTQIFDLGKVDLDKVIDVLHMNNIMGLYTFDPDDSKDAIPAIRYNWFRGEHTATLYLSPVRQQTFGMRFTEFREEIEKTEEEEKEQVSFLRDYFGMQYQWTGDILDARFGLFHWFDSNPYIKLEYQRVTDNDSTTLQGSFENMLSNYDEQETRSDFLTLELDAVWSDMVWKLESGLFKKRNFYSYEVPEGKHVRLSTISSPHFAFSTSFERTFKYFYWLMIYSHRKSYDVPADTQIFHYENESNLIPHKRDVERNQFSGVAVLKTPDNSLRITLLNYQTWPFVQHGFASLFTWERFKDDMELELKFFRLETERQKMLENKIQTNQIFLTYTQKFTAN